MARYIDADALASKIKIIGDYCTENSKTPCMSVFLAFAECIAEAPAADVVSKSEVAREIFEEIEKEIKKSLEEHKNKKLQFNIDDALFHLYHGITASQMGMLDFIAELKRKYMEGEE